MSGVFQLGPFVIRLDWLYYGLSLFLGIVITKRFVKIKLDIAEPYMDYILNALFIGLMIWKLSPMLSEPALLTRPFDILLVPGTLLGVELSFIGALLYMVYVVLKRKLNWRLMLDVMTVVLVISSIVFLISHWQYGFSTLLPWGIAVKDPAFRYHPINVYQSILMVPLLVAMYRLPIGCGKIASVGLVGYGCISLVISMLRPKSEVLFNLSASQYAALLFVVVGVMLMKEDLRSHNKNQLIKDDPS